MHAPRLSVDKGVQAWKLLQFRVRRNVSWVPACQVRRKTRLLARPSQGNATNGAPFSSPQPRRVKSNRVDSTLLNFQKSSSARERRRASERSIFRPRGSCSRAWVPPTASIFHVLHGKSTTAVFRSLRYALTKGSSSPSMTPAMSEVSHPVRTSLTSLYGWKT